MLNIFRQEERQTSEAAKRAIAREEMNGLSFMLWGRLAVLGLLATWVLFNVPGDRANLYLFSIAAFALVGSIPYLLARLGLGSFVVVAMLLVLEVSALSYIVIFAAPFDIESWTPQLNLRLPGFLYLVLFLVAMGLSYSPLLVICIGVASIIAWSVGYFWVASLPDTVLTYPLDLLHEGVNSDEFIERYLDPHAVRPNFFLNQIAILSAVSVVVALTVWRSRALVHRVLSAETDRADALEQQRFIREAFGKFVPDAVVTQLLDDRGQLSPKTRLATVLFADLEGFTALSKRVSPDMLLSVLNEYFDEAGAIVTQHGGTITQFQGDALLASFNVPTEDQDHAFHAVSAANALVAMTHSRSFQGEVLRVRIGINTGEVAAGAVGGTDRVTYTIHGECVNIAARLEQLNKKTGTQILMTAKTAQAVRGTIKIELVGEFEVRGISKPMKLYTTA